MIGSQISPWVLLMSTELTIGPVHEKETSTRVSAIKNTPTRPPLSLFSSVLFTIQLGIVISNAPKKLAANTIKMIKNRIFGIQCVASQLKISAVTASPPKI